MRQMNYAGVSRCELAFLTTQLLTHSS